MDKKANSKSLPEKSTAKADDTMENNELSAVDNSGSADTSDEEMAMFDKIMGEIEGQSQDEAQGNDNGAAEDAESMTPVSEDQQDESLDEDQQKAFEKIMAQIENGDKTDDAPADDDSGDEVAASEEDDFAAELEKVAKEAETASQADAAAPDADDDGDELDEDQRKALESIMAQIEGNNDKADDAPQDADSSDDVEASEEEDFTAELEKVAKEAETASQADGAAPDADDDGDELDDEQQNALESIMAEIEGKNAEQSTANADVASSGESETKHPSVQGAPPEKSGEKKDKDSGSEDISDDIEDILKEITSDLDASDDRGADKKSGAGALEASSRDQNDVTNEKAEAEEKAVDKPLTGQGTQPEEVASITKPAAKAKTAEAKAVESKKESKQNTPTKNTVPVLKSIKSSRIGKKTAILIGAISIISLSLAWWYYGKPHSGESDPVPAAPIAEENVKQQRIVPPATVEAPPPGPVNDDSSDQYRLKTIADEIDQLRAELISKRKEIEDLRIYYQTGIDAEMNSLVSTFQNSVNEKITLNHAMRNPNVSMGIKAIQRRASYILKLENPANALYLNSEELLYLFRKAGLLAMLTDKTSDIDVDGFIEQAQTIMAAHRKALAQLNIDEVDVPEPDIDTIWQQIASRLETVAKSADSTRSRQGSEAENQKIWAAVCSGNFSQKHKLTALSPEAAQCLASWKGKDLFLNELTTLTPAAAGRLADWKGEWLGLNGLKDLTPETAVYLAKWKGRGLSLNGLTRLSPRVVAILSEWQGDQIELVNVRHMAHWENPNTRLFLSEEMRHKIDGRKQ